MVCGTGNLRREGRGTTGSTVESPRVCGREVGNSGEGQGKHEIGVGGKGFQRGTARIVCWMRV